MLVSSNILKRLRNAELRYLHRILVAESRVAQEKLDNAVANNVQKEIVYFEGVLRGIGLADIILTQTFIKEENEG